MRCPVKAGQLKIQIIAVIERPLAPKLQNETYIISTNLIFFLIPANAGIFFALILHYLFYTQPII